MKIAKIAALLLAAAVLLGGGYMAGMLLGLYGGLTPPYPAVDAPTPKELLASRMAEQFAAGAALGVERPSQILFGDLHVHTTYSGDAFYFSLPIMQGDGAHPPSDACDFARYCSALDFWSINDHAEQLTPWHWTTIKESIRQCNAVSGNPANPDQVAFIGWEWTPMGFDRKTNFGHKNVIFRDLGDHQVPARPIGSKGFFLPEKGGGMLPLSMRLAMTFNDFSNRQRYYNLEKILDEWSATPWCEKGVNTRDLPENCTEYTDDPRGFFEKLDQWGFDSIVIPHGNAWGSLTPPGTSWDKQLAGGNHDPGRQTLIEVYSGHGNSEEYRPWRTLIYHGDGSVTCPGPGHNYKPACWRAGEIIYERCIAAGLDEGECKARAADTRRFYADGGSQGANAVPGATANDWLDAGQCRDCFLPVFKLRPMMSAQYGLAITNFDDADNPLRLRYGFIGSSDGHRGRPGVGYKEFARHLMTDSKGPGSRQDAEGWYHLPGERSPKGRPVPESPPRSEGLGDERLGTYFTTGGLVAVHSAGRDRNSIWHALKHKQVYGTSGPRILLWFHMLNAPGGNLAMGGEVKFADTPRFRVRAAGAFKQKPGCPEYSLNSLQPARLDQLCRGECYNPSDERYLITRIEVVRIKPQAAPGEPIDPLIQTPWRSFPCAADASGCVVEFEDPEYRLTRRDTVYYVRAIQEPKPKINGDALRCTYDEEGNCIENNICHGDFRTDPSDDCLSNAEDRAWSSPIFVDYDRG